MIIEYGFYFALALGATYLFARAAATGWFNVKLRYQKRIMGLVSGGESDDGQPKAD